MLVKIEIFSKIQISVKNTNFGRKSIFCSKIQIFFKNPNLDQKSKFCPKSTLWAKIDTLGQNRNFGQKSYSTFQIFKDLQAARLLNDMLKLLLYKSW